MNDATQPSEKELNNLTGDYPIQFVETEQQFLNKLKKFHALPIGIDHLNDITPLDISTAESAILTELSEKDQKFFQQSLIAYAWRAYELSATAMVRILESVVDDYMKLYSTSLEQPSPPSHANKDICKICDIKKKFFSGGLRQKINSLIESSSIKSEQKKELSAIIEIIKKTGQEQKHPTIHSINQTEARNLISLTISLLTKLKYVRESTANPN